MTKGWIYVVGLLSVAASLVSAQEVPPVPHREGWLLMVSPIAGVNRNEVQRRDARGQRVELKETAPQYGLFLLASRGEVTLTDYVFWTEVNDTKVGGNLFFANLYGRRDRGLGWNVGAGHLYHWIETSAGDITVDAPMIKAGPVLTFKSAGLRVNPYAGYVWESVDSPRGRNREGAMLYGVSLGWRRQRAGVSLKYYFQDGRDRETESYHTLRLRGNWQFSRHWGGVVRFDYMEHVTSDDVSVMAGPVYRF